MMQWTDLNEVDKCYQRWADCWRLKASITNALLIIKILIEGNTAHKVCAISLSLLVEICKIVLPNSITLNVLLVDPKASG